jgi:hypothetical protein
MHLYVCLFFVMTLTVARILTEIRRGQVWEVGGAGEWNRKHKKKRGGCGFGDKESDAGAGGAGARTNEKKIKNNRGGRSEKKAAV